LAQRLLIASHVGELDQNAAAREAVCALGLRYVYTGTPANPLWEPRRFPTVDQLRASAALQEVFTRGGVSVFRVRLDCGG
jgi:hypothetical protein